MAQRPSQAARIILESLPPLPFDDAHWAAIVRAVSLSPRQSEIVELILRDATTKQIEIVLGIKAPAIKEQRDRIAGRTGTRGRMADLERKYADHDETIQVVFDAIRKLMEPPPVGKKRQIGFIVNDDQ